MKDNDPISPSHQQSGARSFRQPEDYVQQLSAETLAALKPSQLEDIHRVIALALPDPAPKVLDVRFGINLLFARYFVVFFMGKERRKNARSRGLSWLSKVINAAIATGLVLSINLFVSLSLAIALYLVKSALGIDLLEDQHLSDFAG